MNCDIEVLGPDESGRPNAWALIVSPSAASEVSGYLASTGAIFERDILGDGRLAFYCQSPLTTPSPEQPVRRQPHQEKAIKRSSRAAGGR